MYRFITNPKNGEKVNVNSKMGKIILKNYLIKLEGGQPSNPFDDKFPGQGEAPREYDTFPGQGEAPREHDKFPGEDAAIEQALSSYIGNRSIQDIFPDEKEAFNKKLQHIREKVADEGPGVLTKLLRQSKELMKLAVIYAIIYVIMKEESSQGFVRGIMEHYMTHGIL